MTTKQTCHYCGHDRTRHHVGGCKDGCSCQNFKQAVPGICRLCGTPRSGSATICVECSEEFWGDK